MNYYFGTYQGYAIFKGKTTQAESESLVYITETEYNDVILPAKKVNGVWVSVDPSEVPTPPTYDPYEGMTNEEIRKILYNSEKSIEWQSEMLTVDEANILFTDYFAENKIDIVTEISDKIQVAKNDIRTRYPVENEEIAPVTTFSLGSDPNTELMLLSTLGFEVADTDLAIETLVEKNTDKLVHIPIVGETWRENANYMKGDEVVSTVDNQTYIAQLYSKNKEPSLGIMKSNGKLYWELKPTTPSYPNYEDLAEDVIKKNVICIYNNLTWICTKQHFKSVVYLPEDGSKYWEVM